MNTIVINYLMPLFLLFPMISHWIFPSGLEILLTIITPYYAFYIPDVFIFIYILLYKRYAFFNIFLLNNQKKTMLVVSFLLIGYAFCLGIANDNSEILLPITSCFSWLYITVIFVFFPLSKTQLECTKFFIIPALLVICLEVVLYSLGILHYTSSSGEMLRGQEYGGISRISTTIGAATGTALIILILGIICTSKYKIPLWLKVCIYLLVSISIIFTISRGSIITWLVYLFCSALFWWLSKGVVVKKVFVPVFVIGVVATSNYLGLFDPLVQRNEMLSSSKQIESNRDVLRAKSLNIASVSYYLGVGLGQVFPEKSISELIHSNYRTAPHNTYLVVLAELGVFGLILFLFVIGKMLFSLNYTKVSSISFAVLLLVNFNSEGVMLFPEFWTAFIVFYLNVDKKNETSIYLYA